MHVGVGAPALDGEDGLRDLAELDPVGLRHELGHVPVLDGSLDHGDSLPRDVLEPADRRRLGHEQERAGHEVRVRELDHLAALVGDRHRRDDDVDLPRLEEGNAVAGGDRDQLDLVLVVEERLREPMRDVDVEADVLPGGVDRAEGWEVGLHACDQLAALLHDLERRLRFHPAGGAKHQREPERHGTHESSSRHVHASYLPERKWRSIIHRAGEPSGPWPRRRASRILHLLGRQVEHEVPRLFPMKSNDYFRSNR